MSSRAGRIGAAIVALVAATGLIVQYDATFAQTGSAVETLWVMLHFFTVLTNMAVVPTLAAIAIGWRVAPRWIGGVLLAILLVGVVYGLLLRGLLTLSGGALLADTLMHKVTPILVPLWWIAFARKGCLGWRDPWVWTIFPAAYLPYALLRGTMEDGYAYPFINVAELGIGQVLTNALLIAVGFLVAGYGLVWIDRRLSSGRNADVSAPPV